MPSTAAPSTCDTLVHGTWLQVAPLKWRTSVAALSTRLPTAHMSSGDVPTMAVNCTWSPVSTPGCTTFQDDPFQWNSNGCMTPAKAPLPDAHASVGENA